MFYKLLSEICNNNIQRNHILIMNLIYIWLKFFYALLIFLAGTRYQSVPKKNFWPVPGQFEKVKFESIKSIIIYKFQKRSSSLIGLDYLNVIYYFDELSVICNSYDMSHTVWIITEQFDWKLMLMKKIQKKRKACLNNSKFFWSDKNILKKKNTVFEWPHRFSWFIVRTTFVFERVWIELLRFFSFQIEFVQSIEVLKRGEAAQVPKRIGQVQIICLK